MDNETLVFYAFDTLCNRRDCANAERYWSPHYVQHRARIEPGQDGLFELIKSIPSTLRSEHGVIVANGDYGVVHGRFSDNGRPRVGRGGTSCESRMAYLQAIGMSCRTRRTEMNQKAAARCSGSALPSRRTRRQYDLQMRFGATSGAQIDAAVGITAMIEKIPGLKVRARE
jgi:hypothetical protein